MSVRRQAQQLATVAGSSSTYAAIGSVIDVHEAFCRNHAATGCFGRARNGDTPAASANAGGTLCAQLTVTHRHPNDRYPNLASQSATAFSSMA